MAGIRQAYFEVSVLPRRTAIVNQLVDIVPQSVAAMRRLVETGLLVQLDVPQLEVELRRLEVERNAARRELPASPRRLATAVEVPGLPIAAIAGGLRFGSVLVGFRNGASLKRVATISDDNFGPLIAYLVPGATALAGLGPFSETLRSWFAASPSNAATIGGFLYLTIAALAAGMTVSAVRWVIVDSLHAHTGLPPPKLNFARLAQNVDAFELLINIHYRHYQFYANMFVASAFAYVGYRFWLGTAWPLGWIDLAFGALELVFFATSRDTLRKYYIRGQELLAIPGERRGPPSHFGD